MWSRRKIATLAVKAVTYYALILFALFALFRLAPWLQPWTSSWVGETGSLDVARKLALVVVVLVGVTATMLLETWLAIRADGRTT